MNCVMLHLVGYTWKYVCDARTHERRTQKLIKQKEIWIMNDRFSSGITDTEVSKIKHYNAMQHKYDGSVLQQSKARFFRFE